ncbi:putative leucine-rich repeat domain superfamily [Helianthus debilis subsp. tardiflorus]
MSGNNISSLPQSLKLLTKLRTLDLSGNKSLGEISVLGELRCLQILKLTSTGITKIPEEIGQLTKLRLLDVYSCLDLSYVAPCVISKFTWLEELYVRLLKEEEGSCNFIEELSELKLLKILHLKLPNLLSIPEKANFQTLIEFDIGEPVDGNTLYYCKRRLHISESSFPFNMPTMKLIQVSEGLELSYIKDLDNILDLYQESFDELKYIELRSCGNVTSLVKTGDLDAMRSIFTLDEPGQGKTKGKFFSHLKSIMVTNMCSLELLWDSPHQCISFCNLVKIYVKNCPSLLELFPLSVAQGLVNLKDLYISDCERLVAAISARDEQTGGSNTELVKHDPYIMFPVADVHLDNLPKLESFYSGYSMIKYPSLRSMKVKDCCSMKRLLENK